MSISSEYAGHGGMGRSQQEIPVVDVGPFLSGVAGALDDLGQHVRRAFETIGFLYITNHGVPQELIDRVFRENVRFHALPDTEKTKVFLDPKAIGGYLPFGVQRIRTFDPTTGEASTRAFAKPDVGEAFFIPRELRHDADGEKWPRHLPGFRETVVEYFDALETLSSRLLPAIATALGLPADFFASYFDSEQSNTQLRLSHYPATPLEDDQYNTAPHCDGDFFTLLAQSVVPGLQLFDPSGEWVSAPARPGDLLMNCGEMLRIWSNDRLLSTRHRVINSSGVDRYAIPFFYYPAPDTLIQCLETCRDTEHPPRHEPIAVGAYSEWFFKENFALEAK